MILTSLVSDVSDSFSSLKVEKEKAAGGYIIFNVIGFPVNCFHYKQV